MFKRQARCWRNSDWGTTGGTASDFNLKEALISNNGYPVMVTWYLVIMTGVDEVILTWSWFNDLSYLFRLLWIKGILAIIQINTLIGLKIRI